jgi:flagellar assembly factor FliW
MKINTVRFGEINVKDESCFKVVDPILGYNDEQEFVLIENQENSNFKWLQSVKTPELAFVVTFAGFFGIDYSFDLAENVQESLGISGIDDIIILNIVMIPHNKPQDSTINLLAPLVFNIKNNKFSQVILSGSGFKVDQQLFEKEAIC